MRNRYIIFKTTITLTIFWLQTVWYSVQYLRRRTLLLNANIIFEPTASGQRPTKWAVASPHVPMAPTIGSVTMHLGESESGFSHAVSCEDP